MRNMELKGTMTKTKVRRLFGRVNAAILVIAILFCFFGCESRGTADAVSVKFALSGQDKVVSVEKGSALSENDIPNVEKDGYTFLYWSSGDAVFDLKFPINADVVLTPVYKANEYVLSFEGFTETKNVTFNSPIGKLPEIPEINIFGEIGFWSIDGMVINENSTWTFTENKTAIQKNSSYIVLDAYNGGKISLVSDTVNEYLSKPTEAQTAEYLYNYERNFRRAEGPNPVLFSWENLSGESLKFTLKVATDTEFDNMEYAVDTYATETQVYNLIPGKHFYKVVCSNGAESETDFFEIVDTLRQIECGEIYNMRDEGGYIGDFGKVRYGLVYRSTDPSIAGSVAVDVLVNQLGIKTQLDLRTDRTVTPPDESLSYVKAGIWHNDYIFPDFNPNRPFSESNAVALKTAFSVFTRESNYPILFHCTSGADRTGTFAFLLGGLHGVSYDDLVRDFEITSFYTGTRWRSKIISDNGTYSFDASGVMRDDEINLVAFGKMYNHMIEAYGTGDGKLSSAVENYLKTVVGLSDKNISDIRSIMIEE